jgi:hypothetical protein
MRRGTYRRQDAKLGIESIEIVEEMEQITESSRKQSGYSKYGHQDQPQSTRAGISSPSEKVRIKIQTHATSRKRTGNKAARPKPTS